MATASGEAVTRALAAEIKRLRTERGWSQEALAGQAGVHRTFVGLVESGQRGISIARAVQLAEALDTPLSDLIRRAEASL